MSTQQIIDAWDSGVEPYNATEADFEPYKPKFRHWEDNYTNARRIREIIRGVQPANENQFPTS